MLARRVLDRIPPSGPSSSTTPPPFGARCVGRPNVTLGSGTSPSLVTGLLVSRRRLGRQGRRCEAPARKVTQRARLVPRLTIRPSLLTLAFLAPLTAGTGVGNRLSAIDDGPGGAKSPPPAINHKEKETMTTTTTTVVGNLTRDPELFWGCRVS